MTATKPQKGSRKTSGVTIANLAADDMAEIGNIGPSAAEKTFLFTHLRFRGTLQGLGIATGKDGFLFLARGSATAAEVEAEWEGGQRANFTMDDVFENKIIFGDPYHWHAPIDKDAARVDWKVKLPKKGLPSPEDIGWDLFCYNNHSTALVAGAAEKLFTEYVGVWL